MRFRHARVVMRESRIALYILQYPTVRVGHDIRNHLETHPAL
jgi:hypothetical protein